MKTNQIINWLTIALAFVGVLFKTMHWPGAAMIIVIALLALVVSAVLSFGSNKENGMGDALNYTLTAMLVLLVAGAAFHFFHWPGSHEFRMVGHVIFVILPIIMLVANTENKVSNAFWVPFLVYVLLVISMMTTKINSLKEEIGHTEHQQIETTP